MKLSLSLAALSLLAIPGVLGGLEDAQYSSVLHAGNIDSALAAQEEGTLVAFFAPWCGHCKNLEPVWTKVAQAFEGDDRCKVAHFNADEPANKPVAQKYGVSGYPTLKFIKPASRGGAIEDYRGPRTEEGLLAFLNEHCGTHKLPGGLLGDLAGRIPSLDTLASLYLTPTATRPALLSSASALASSLTDSSSSLASYYLKLFNKWADIAADESGEKVQEAREWIEKERTRLGKIAGKKGQVAVKKLEEARMKQNILAAFASASASASSLSSAASATVSSASSLAAASGSSVLSAGSAAATDAQASAASLASEASKSAGSAYGQATESAESAYGEAVETAESVYGEASSTVSSVVEKATGRVKEEL
ncbi:hypothetical protein JCM6882_002181 [Rhodosporidiobolus microsporus]